MADGWQEARLGQACRATLISLPTSNLPADSPELGSAVPEPEPCQHHRGQHKAPAAPGSPSPPAPAGLSACSPPHPSKPGAAWLHSRACCSFWRSPPQVRGCKNRNAPLCPTNQWRAPAGAGTCVARHCHGRTFALHAPPCRAVLQRLGYLKAKKQQQKNRLVSSRHGNIALTRLDTNQVNHNWKHKL